MVVSFFKVHNVCYGVETVIAFLRHQKPSYATADIKCVLILFMFNYYYLATIIFLQQNKFITFLNNTMIIVFCTGIAALPCDKPQHTLEIPLPHNGAGETRLQTCGRLHYQ